MNNHDNSHEYVLLDISTSNLPLEELSWEEVCELVNLDDFTET